MHDTPENTLLLQTIGKFVSDQVRAATEPLLARIEELEKGGISFHGTHQRALSYRRGALVNFDGSIFIAVADVSQGEIPGQSKSWQLAVKAGRDAPRLPTGPRTTR